MALTQLKSEGIKDGEVKNADMADDAVGVAELSATGTASSSTFLRGDNSWATPTDTNTVTTINNNADNRVITGSGTANTLEGEDKLTWNGNNLHIERTVTAYEQPLVNIYNSGAYGWGGAIRFSANWANTEEHQATIKTYGGSSATGASLAFNVGAANSEKLRIQNGGGISFNGDTAAANALNDYEEGTWTPSLYNSGGLTVHSANYTKIGQLCNVNAYVTISTNSSSSALRFNSLPFTAANVGYFIGSAYTQNTGGTHVFTQIDGNSTNLTVYKNDGSTIYQSDVSGGYVLFSGIYRTT